jgi:hypothetical protein
MCERKGKVEAKMKSIEFHSGFDHLNDESRIPAAPPNPELCAGKWIRNPRRNSQKEQKHNAKHNPHSPSHSPENPQLEYKKRAHSSISLVLFFLRFFPLWS